MQAIFVKSKAAESKAAKVRIAAGMGKIIRYHVSRIPAMLNSSISVGNLIY